MRAEASARTDDARQRGPVTPPPLIDANMRYSMREAAAILRMGLGRFYDRLKKDKSPPIATFYDGKRRYIMGDELIRLSRPPGTDA